jgi:nucleoid DNA-binding protein
VNLSSLVRRIKCKYPQITYKIINDVLHIYQETILQELKTRQQSSIRTLGTIRLKNLPPRKARNPQNGNILQLPQRTVARIKLSKSALKILTRDAI